MWQGIRGHDAVVDYFRRALAAGRLATTYLFVGPEGVGKRAFALELARALLCQRADPARLEACGECESCRLAAAGNHPDIDLIGFKLGKRRLGIDQFIGEGDDENPPGLCRKIAMRPMLGRRRIAIIEEADWFTPESANCLLKTLEEPPPGAVIILIGTSRSRQLPTILSRSQVVRFEPLPADVVAELLLSQGAAADRAAAETLAQRSEGSLSQAAALGDPELWQMRDKFAAQWNSDRFDFGRTATAINQFVSSAGKEAEPRRNRLKQFLALVVEMFRESLRVRLSSGSSGDPELALIDRTLQAQEQVDRNANQATLIESWMNDLVTAGRS